MLTRGQTVIGTPLRDTQLHLIQERRRDINTEMLWCRLVGADRGTSLVQELSALAEREDGRLSWRAV